MIEKLLISKTQFFNIITTTSYAFSPSLNKSLHAAFIKICTSRGEPLSPSPLLEKRQLSPHCAYIYHVVSINVQYASLNVNEYNFFFRIEEFSDSAFLHMEHAPGPFVISVALLRTPSLSVFFELGSQELDMVF